VAFGLSILIALPGAVVTSLIEDENATAVTTVIGLVTNVLSFVAVLPVIFISGTLIYLDLRVRQEELNIQSLANEMGVARG
jgi:hypothetical protein